MRTMSPGLRKFALTLHIVAAVGWLGAVVAYLAVAIAGLASRDAELARGAYLSLDVIARFVIVPFSLATLVAGVVESLGTPWGLFRYWWVAVKFALTVVATAILLQHLPTIARMAEVAREGTWSPDGYLPQRTQLIVHAGGGLLVLLAATVLSVYKPWGLTPYGRRQQFAPQPRPELVVAAPAPIASPTPRWKTIVGYHIRGIAVLLLIAHVVFGGMHAH